MPTPSRMVKLNAGEAITMKVASTSFAPGKYGKDVCFEGTTREQEAVHVFVKVETADRQLGRHALDMDSAVGRILTFAKIEKNGQKYIDIDLPNGKGPASGVKSAETGKSSVVGRPDNARQQPAPAPPLAPRSDTFKRLFAAYDLCFAHALAVSQRAAHEYECTVDPGAIAATLFIQASQQGLV